MAIILWKGRTIEELLFQQQNVAIETYRVCDKKLTVSQGIMSV